MTKSRPWPVIGRTIFFTSDKNRPTNQKPAITHRDEIYFIDFWRENLSMYRININTSSKHHATQTTPKKPSHSASSSESAAYVLPTPSLTNEAENSSSTLPNVVITAPHYKEMRIAFTQFHVTQPFNRKNRNPPKLTGHRLSHPSTLRFLKYHLSSTSIPLSLKLLPTAKNPSLTHQL